MKSLSPPRTEGTFYDSQLRFRFSVDRLVRSGGLRRTGAFDLRHQVSERINHLKTAAAADIEMGILFLCEGDGVTCESKDVE